MHSKLLRALFLEDFVALYNLVVREAVFRVFRRVHYVRRTVRLELAAGVIAAANCFGNTREFVENINVREIVKVDDCAELKRLLEISVGRCV